VKGCRAVAQQHALQDPIGSGKDEKGFEAFAQIADDAPRRFL
jgi:hypothetical protein